jgi:hypothetical protein
MNRIARLFLNCGAISAFALGKAAGTQARLFDIKWEGDR